jgi:hypothetical protein
MYPITACSTQTDLHGRIGWRTIAPRVPLVARRVLPGDRRGRRCEEDFHFREKLFHFDHERIPERVVHARGFGAHGFFENYEPLGELTRADLLATTCRCSSSRTR